MNALYADARGAVIDPLGGLPDLLARHVRFVGDAHARIAEDYLRILRFFRFHAVYGDAAAGIDAEGLAACAAHLDGLPGLSRERIGAEMRKLLSAADPAPALASMAACGVLATILPGADPRFMVPLVQVEGGQPPRWLRRLAVLGGQNITEALRLSRAESADLGRIRDEIGSALTPAALGWKLGPALANDTLLARAALFGTPLPPAAGAEIARGAAASFPIAAADLMPALTGAALGKRLQELQARWLASDLRPTKPDLLGPV